MFSNIAPANAGWRLRLVEKSLVGGYTMVKDAVRELTQRNQEVSSGPHLGSQRPKLPAGGCQTPAQKEASPLGRSTAGGRELRLDSPPAGSF